MKMTEEERTNDQALSNQDEERLIPTKFKAISGEALVDSFPLLRETDRSMEVARAVAARLNAADPKTIVLVPYNQTSRITVSALKSPQNLRDRVNSETCPQEIVAGSRSESGMVIDAMLHQNEALDCLSEPSRLSVTLTKLGISVSGTPDAAAFDCPVELKTIATLTPGMSYMPDELYSFYYGHTPFRNLCSWLMQLGMYQQATGGEGFLVLVSRDTGAVVCYESPDNLPLFVEYHHNKWLTDYPAFERIVNDIRQIDTSMDDCDLHELGLDASV